jgi:hypothetical protein
MIVDSSNRSLGRWLTLAIDDTAAVSSRGLELSSMVRQHHAERSHHSRCS